ncbi:MAG: chloride channel protein [bacterium]|nr:chloride channel protein [bacterium]
MKQLNSRIRTIFINLDSRAQMVIIGIIVGLVSGLAAVGLNKWLHFLSHELGHYKGTVYFLLFPMVGIVLTVLFLKYVARDFGGHGVPEVIHSVSMKGGALKLRSAFSRLLGSLITLSCHASAGPEAPIVISGAAIGSNVAAYFKSNEKIKIAVAGSGAAAAIAAIFNAPITGIIFTMEVILGEWSYRTMLPVAISSVTGTVVSRMLQGNQIPFAHRVFNVNVNDILATVGLSVAIAFFAFVFIKTLKWSSALLDKYLSHFIVKAFVGGSIVSGIILFFPRVGGEGYDVVRQVISGEFKSGIGILLVLVAMKMLATAFTLGAGGAGGVFAPSLVIGSLVGFFYFKLLVFLFPGTEFTGAGLFALVAMAGMISGTMQAPLSGIFLIVEITGGYDAILPLLLVSFLTTMMVKHFEKHSIYHYELVKKGHLLRPQTDARILSDIKTEELLETDLTIVRPDMLLKEMIPIIKKSKYDYFPVEDAKTGNFLGMVYFSDIKKYLFDPALLNFTLVSVVMHNYRELTLLSLEETVSCIADKFDVSNFRTLPVVHDGKFLGIISKATILDHYRKELKAQTEH